MRDGDGQNRDLNVVDASRYQKTNLLLLGICKSEPPPWWWCVVQIGVLTMMGILCASDDDSCDVDGSHSVLTNPFTSLLIIDHNHQRAASFICIHYYVDVHPPWSIISQASGKLLFRHSNRQKTAASSRNSISTIQFIIFNNSIKNS